MKSKEEYWERVFKGYERSGLSQEDFCSEQGIPIAKFKYQWRKRIASENQKAHSQNKSDKPSHFEPILISSKDSVHQETTSTSQSIIIQFPNQIDGYQEQRFFFLTESIEVAMLIPEEVRVHLYCGITDMRKSINTLAILVKEVFGMELESGHLFLFRSRCGSKIKAPYYEGTGG